MRKPLVSVCIPVYGSEPFLAECLESLGGQDFEAAEIIIVNDGSTATDSEGKTCKEIVKSFKKHSPYKINYIEHSENLGLLEARRTAIYAAKGEYIAVVDSDDRLLPGALKTLYDTAIQTDADIVHGSSTSNIEKQRNNAIYIGTLTGHDIFSKWMVQSAYNDALWGKLIKRELYLEALDKIPQMYCNMAEDVVQWFFISLKAKKYVGITDQVYFYNAKTGMTSSRKITTKEELKGLVSPASVFTVIHQWLQEQADQTGQLAISGKELAYLRAMAHQYLANNLLMLKNAVVPELQDAGYELLCTYWGKEFVKKVEAEKQ